MSKEDKSYKNKINIRTYNEDQKILSLHINEENDTLGNLVRESCLQNRDILFAGYRKVHIQDDEIILNIKSINKNPFDSLVDSIDHTISILDDLQNQLENQI